MKRTAFVMNLLAASTVPALAQTPALVPVHVSGTGTDDVSTLLYAQKAGLFRAAGLDPSFERANSGAATIAAVVGGAVDIGKSSMGSLISARAHNIDIKIHAGGATFRSVKGDVWLCVAPDSPLRRAKDLNGKTISVPSLGDQNMLATKVWVDRNGGDSRTLSFLEIPSSAAAAAVGQGRVGAAVMVPPYYARAIGEGKVRTMANVFAAIAPRFLETGWFTTADYAQKHRDLVLHFAKIISDAAGYVNAHGPEIADLMATFSGATAASILDAGISYMATSIDPRRDIQPLVDAMAKYGIIDHRFDASGFLIYVSASARVFSMRNVRSRPAIEKMRWMCDCGGMTRRSLSPSVFRARTMTLSTDESM